MVGRLTGESDQTRSRILEIAVRYFGPGGLGLQVTELTTSAVQFVGGGGHVRVETTTGDRETMTMVEVHTLEWDYHARRFLEEI